MAVSLKIKVGDRRPYLAQQLIDVDGSPIDISGATVTFRWQMTCGGTVYTGTPTILDAATGKVEYRWAEGETDTEGQYAFEWHVDFGGGIDMMVPSGDYGLFEIVPALDGQVIA